MGMTESTIFWVLHLARQGCLNGLRTMLDLGPQDFYAGEENTYRALIENLHSAGQPGLFEEVWQARQRSTRLGLDFWHLFGLESYESLDPYDANATYCYNLNYPFCLGKEYDLVVNCGTYEHIFNIAECFINTDRLLAPGGVVLHILPSSGARNHGFYSFQPILFSHVARANGYDILHELTVHGINECNKALAEAGYQAERFSSGSTLAPQGMEELNLDSYFCVAMRKQARPRNVPFRFPEQEMWL